MASRRRTSGKVSTHMHGQPDEQANVRGQPDELVSMHGQPDEQANVRGQPDELVSMHGQPDEHVFCYIFIFY